VGRARPSRQGSTPPAGRPPTGCALRCAALWSGSSHTYMSP
jgi:hypothetical protein